jgi:hypothetical protein
MVAYNKVFLRFYVNVTFYINTSGVDSLPQFIDQRFFLPKWYTRQWCILQLLES